MDQEKQSAGAAAEMSPRVYRRHSNLDVLSTFSFITAGLMGAYNICNSIRTRFYHSFVEGYNESRTPFTDIIEKYNGKSGMPDTASTLPDGKYDELAMKHRAGEIDGVVYIKERKALTAEFRSEINKRLLEDFNIPSRGIKGWTTGTIKRWEQLGSHARRDASLGFATVAAVGIGAIGLLRHNKHILDNVDQKLDNLSDSQLQR